VAVAKSPASLTAAASTPKAAAVCRDTLRKGRVSSWRKKAPRGGRCCGSMQPSHTEVETANAKWLPQRPVLPGDCDQRSRIQRL